MEDITCLAEVHQKLADTVTIDSNA